MYQTPYLSFIPSQLFERQKEKGDGKEGERECSLLISFQVETRAEASLQFSHSLEQLPELSAAASQGLSEEAGPASRSWDLYTAHNPRIPHGSWTFKYKVECLSLYASFSVTVTSVKTVEKRKKKNLLISLCFTLENKLYGIDNNGCISSSCLD